MPSVEVVTKILAPVGVMFRSGEKHRPAYAFHGEDERAGRGRRVQPDSLVSARKLRGKRGTSGVRQRLTSQDYGVRAASGNFRDSQVSWRLRRFDHGHFFRKEERLTVMTDVFDYQSPMGWLGRIAELHYFWRATCGG